MFGEDFSGYKEEELEPESDAAVDPKDPSARDPAKATKGKLNAKSTGLKYQFQVLESIGVPRSEIHKFRVTDYWLKYFPPIAHEDLNALGARIDWRRSFITTDYNLYYDSFVRWQVNKLRAQDKIKFGERYTIFSPKDNQPCMDHDRSEGEALNPQEYTGLKMEVVQWAPNAAPQVDALTTAQGKKVYFIAATLRPETMYGQTNCFVGPKIDYGLFEASNDEVFVCTERAARNMAFQGVFDQRGEVKKVATIKGSDLVGSLIKAPFGIKYPEIRVLPMDTVLPTKGTGVVTSVPSDSPDDYTTLRDLQKKAEFYGIDPTWVRDLEPVAVLNTPNYGNLVAEAVVQKLKIQSPKDVKALAEAKEIAYKEGFYNGKLIVGEFAGQAVQDAKPKVRDAMIKANLAFAYAEPEGRVVSRSGDECVVALMDQWYLDYGEEEWQKLALKEVSKLNTFTPDVKNAFEAVIGWLHQWACARGYGLGTKLPWDPNFLVESLSDSTIYMAFYTVAHLIQGGGIRGTVPGPLGITHEQMTDPVWDYIFGDISYAETKQTAISEEKLNILRREFRYFYPMDFRTSGKDLIPNHLTFCIYNHTALFPESQWPQAIRANGHLMLNGEKMSKSKGNSLTLRDGVEKFGADAMRISLADAGDGIEDANFEEKGANSNILRIHTLLEWATEMVKEAKNGNLRTGPKDSFWDASFENEINLYISKTKADYEQTLYKEATRDGFYEMIIARDLYRDATQDIKMHVDLVTYWIKTLALLICPIAPHMAEHLWTGILEQPRSIQFALWPEPSKPVEEKISAATEYARLTTKRIRDQEIAAIAAAKSGKKGGKKNANVGWMPDTYAEKEPKELRIFVAKSFPLWQQKIASVVDKLTDAEGKTDDVAVRKELAAAGLLKEKKAMPFVVSLKDRLKAFDRETTFKRTLPFDELTTLKGIQGYLSRTMQFSKVTIEPVEELLAALPPAPKDAEAFPDRKTLELAEPARPSFVFYNTGKAPTA